MCLCSLHSESYLGLHTFIIVQLHNQCCLQSQHLICVSWFSHAWYTWHTSQKNYPSVESNLQVTLSSISVHIETLCTRQHAHVFHLFIMTERVDGQNNKTQLLVNQNDPLNVIVYTCQSISEARWWVWGVDIPQNSSLGTSCLYSSPDIWLDLLPPADTRNLCCHRICRKIVCYFSVQ